jgi:hypothetical protein
MGYFAAGIGSAPDAVGILADQSQPDTGDIMGIKHGSKLVGKDRKFDHGRGHKVELRLLNRGHLVCPCCRERTANGFGRKRKLICLLRNF